MADPLPQPDGAAATPETAVASQVLQQQRRQLEQQLQGSTCASQRKEALWSCVHGNSQQLSLRAEQVEVGEA